MIRWVTSMVPVFLFLVCCCSSPQQTTESSSPETGDAADESSPESASGESNAAGESTATESSVPACPAEEWLAAYPEAENDAPPAAYLTCSADGECAERVTVVCCGRKAVAVNMAHRDCIAERSNGANCRAHCVQTSPGETDPERTPTCVEGSCRLVTEDGTPQQMVDLLWVP